MTKMVNMRIDPEMIAWFDKVADVHKISRTKELKRLMIQAIKAEFPDAPDFDAGVNAPITDATGEDI